MSETNADGVGTVVRTLAAMADGQADTARQKRTLLAGLAKACGADAWVWALTRTKEPGVAHSLPVTVLRLDDGFDDAGRETMLRAQQSPHRRVFAEKLYASVQTAGRATCRRQDLLADDAWHGSDYFREFIEPLGFDEFLFGVRVISHTDVSTVALFRRRDRTPFEETALHTVGLTLDNVDWLHRHGDVSAVAAAVVGLTPRQRQVLALLIAGEGRKQIAATLKISEHTVADYQKTIYRLFGVSSRGELQARVLDGHSPA